MILACEALIRYAPPIFVDTTGYAFTFPVRLTNTFDEHNRQRIFKSTCVSNLTSLTTSLEHQVARWLAGSVVGCYVHYPTISTDMLEAVASRTASFNNDASIAQARTLQTTWCSMINYECSPTEGRPNCAVCF
eukprot:SAG31_NODE_1343_length_8700_cov_1.967911_9_plen_133_part_00